jgi:hypothetical protein
VVIIPLTASMLKASSWLPERIEYSIRPFSPLSRSVAKTCEKPTLPLEKTETSKWAKKNPRLSNAFLKQNHPANESYI